MRCGSNGEWRAYLDEELLSSDRARLAGHLAGCPACRERLAELRATAQTAQTCLGQPHPATSACPSTPAALARLRASTWQGEPGGRSGRPHDNRRFTMRNGRNRAWRPALAALAVLAIMIGVYSFGPTQAIARQLLSVFRVRRFAVIEVNPDLNQMEEVSRVLEENIFVDEPTVIEDGFEETVATVQEARELAGFEVRVPQNMPGGLSDEGFSVKGHSRAEMQFTGEGLRMILEMADMDAGQIPEDLDQGTVTVDVGAVVAIANPTNNFSVIQMWRPTVEYPEGIDPALLGEAGLRLMGLPEKQARRIAESIDWTTTALLPVPSEFAQVHELEIAGSPAVLILPRSEAGDQQPRCLMWEKDDVVYLINGHASREQLVIAAESMF